MIKKIKKIFIVLIIFSILFVDKFSYAYMAIMTDINNEQENVQKIEQSINSNQSTSDTNINEGNNSGENAEENELNDEEIKSDKSLTEENNSNAETNIDTDDSIKENTLTNSEINQNNKETNLEENLDTKSDNVEEDIIYSVNEEKVLEEGIYEIETALSTNKVIEVIDASVYSGGNVQIFTRNNAKCQKVEIKYTGDGYYTIKFVHSGMYLDVANGGIANGTNVWQCRYNGSDAQKWIISKTENGYFNIISKCSNTYLTVAGGKTANCTNIEINANQNNNSQKFKFNKIETPKGEKIIENGIYEIELGLDIQKVIEVIDASTYSGGNVQIFTRNNAKCQRVEVKYTGDGYYTIKFEHSGLYLDVANGNTENGTNVWQCRENGSDAQKWVINKTEDGYYKIISKSSGTYLTVAGGKTLNCTNIEINTNKDDDSQKFQFNKIEPIKGEKVIEDGIYEIELGLDAKKVLEVVDAKTFSGANVQTFTRNNAKCQKVEIKYDGQGYYTIMFRHSGMYLDVANGNTANGTNVWQCRYNGSDAQKWVISKTEDGYYNIISKCSETYLTVNDGKTANGTNIEINTKKANGSQKFKLNKIEPIKGEKSIEDGIYEIEIGLNNQKVVEVVDAKTSSGANVQIFGRSNVACQKVEIKYDGQGYYTIMFRHSGMYLDVSDGKTANGTNVWQCRYNGSDAQKWIISKTSDGYYNIISKCSETYLTVKDGKTSNCTNIEINTKKNDGSQKFKFNEIKTLKGIDVSKHQGIIDWEKVKKTDIDFAIIRCGYGRDDTLQDDEMYMRNISECERLGIPYGVYIYSYALDIEGAKSEAQHVLRLIKGHSPQLGIWFDMEDADGYKERNGMPSNETLVNICITFCETIKANGYNVGIYANLDWLYNKLNDSRLDIYNKWVAQWNLVCTYNKKYVMWQYTDKGIVDGIQGYVDMNKYYM